MVGGTTHQQQQAPQLAPPSSLSSSTAHTTTTEEDELLKRNTDCVYFLASPLTCKKGSECEYRHSDVARVNPRDCWYWLNGSCLNPKCSFRHPPLDGLLGAEMPTPTGPSVPAAHATPHAMPKQGVACIFFQKGFCLKGQLCPFLHAPPYAVNNKPAQSGSANPDPRKMPQSGPEKPIQEKKSTQHATIPKVTPFLARNGGVDKKLALPSSVEEPPRYKPARVIPPPVMNENFSSKANRGVYHVPENDRILNGKDDEFSREPSPGFDVLVDNEVEDSEYYHDKAEYGRSRGQVYDVDRPVDYGVDRDMYHEQHGRDYDHYSDASSHNPDHFNGLDLRHRISKQRRGSDYNLRLAVGHENHADRILRRESHHHHRPDQGTLSSRLRGRIKIPGRSPSPTKENNSRVEREFDRERRHLSRYSPGRPLALNQGRFRDRIKGHRDMMSDNDTMFVGPKSLSELKSVRTEHQPNDEQFLGKRKYPKVENDLSFEGPKPLSEILKRKKGVNSSNNSNDNDDNNNNNKVNNNHVSSVKNEDNKQKERESVPADNKEHTSVSVDFEAEIEKDKPVDGKSVNNAANEVENEVGLIDEDALLDEELEGYDDHRDGDYEYEQMDGEEDYNLDEGEYVDEEDGNEYGKKEGIVYS